MDFITKNKFAIVTIVILVILNIFTLTTLWIQHNKMKQIFPHRFPMMMNAPNHIRNFLENELNLTKEQEEKFNAAKEKYFKQSAAIMDDSMNLKREIIDEAFKASPDKEKVKQITEKIGARHAEMDRLLFSHIDELKSICKPEQLEKFKKLFYEIFQNNRFPFPGNGRHWQENFPMPPKHQEMGNPPGVPF